MRYFNTIATVFLVGVLFVSCKQETIQGDYFGQEFQVSGKASKTAAPFDQISEKTRSILGHKKAIILKPDKHFFIGFKFNLHPTSFCLANFFDFTDHLGLKRIFL